MKLSTLSLAEKPEQPATWDPVPSNPFDSDIYFDGFDDEQIKAGNTETSKWPETPCSI